jgi:integrase
LDHDPNQHAPAIKRARSGWAEFVGGGIRRDHRLSCGRSAQRLRVPAPGARCRCPYSWWSPQVCGRRRRRERLYGTLANARQLKRQQELDACVERVELKCAAGRHEPVDGLLTIDAYYARWLERDAGRIAPGTSALREGLYRNHLSATFGHMQVIDLDAQSIEDWLHAQQRAGVGYWATKGAFHALQAMFSSAVRKHHVPWNPTSAVRLPAEPVRLERDHMTAVEYRAVVAACTSTAERLWIRLSGEAGLRRGEICALRGERMDTDAHELLVSASIVHVRGRGLVERPPKSGKSRIVSIPPSLVELINSHVALLDLGPADLLFESPAGGAMKPDTLTSRVSKIIHRAGLVTPEYKPAFSLHDLRRTAATLAREAGVDVDVIRDQLGHGDARMTTRHYIRARANPRLSEFAYAMSRIAE